MSRRDSDSRHHRSRFERDPSPKRVRRDGRTTTERPTSNLNLDSSEHIDRDQKHHRRLQDSVPLGPEVVPNSKIETVSLNKESDKKSNGNHGVTKNSSNNIEPPRSRSHFQHDERAGQVGRNFRHKETTERDWWKDSKNGRVTNRISNNDDTKPRDVKTRFDGSYKVEQDSKQPSKKRPSFREIKIPVNESATEVMKIPINAEGSERKEERGKPLEKPPVDRPNRGFSGGRDPHRNEIQRMKFQSRDRHGGGSGGFGGSFRGRDRFNGRQGAAGGRVEKWKHDLYDEANKSPTSKNEEDQIAKVEALLAS